MKCACGAKRDRPGPRCKRCHAADMRERRRLANEERARLIADNEALRAENARLDALLNTPEILDFAKAIVFEAAHQRERWRLDDDSKTDADWFWLIGYLAGKALNTPIGKDVDGMSFERVCEKRLHRIITIAAAAANWHSHIARQLQSEREAMASEVAAQ